MLQTKCIFIEGSQDSDIYLAIVETIKREFEEFNGYRINSDSSSLELEFNVNNNYDDIKPVFINEDVIISEEFLTFVINYFNNEENTNVKININKINEEIFGIQIINEESKIFDIEISKTNKINEEYIFEDNNLNKFNSKSLSDKILNYLSEELGFLFNKNSKNILNRELSMFFLEKDK